MLLAIDIGNTNTSLGLFEGAELRCRWTIGTGLPTPTPDEYGVLLTNLFSSRGMDIKGLKGSLVCSVVPRLGAAVCTAIEGYAGCRASIVTEGLDAGVTVLTDDPAEVGADRLVNAAAGYARHKKALIICDLGTAATFDYVTEAGEYAGGVIAPGVSISADALCARTAKLPRVALARPRRVVGTNTADCIRSGLYWGFAGLVDGIIVRMLEEVGGAPHVMATGGAAPLLAGESRYIKEVAPDLTLHGLRIIYEGKNG
ncbi:MAG: type III pantothenate kinase [Thermodesulfobacteriota bacterium]